jgi:acyl-CoA synthetase (AMP-forming)/AMP-acid ligase II
MYVATHAKTTPDKPAYIMGGTGEAVTYRELDDRSNQLAQLLYDRGLRPGDGFALCMENSLRFFEGTWAGQRSGLYYTAASSRLTTEELEYIVNDCGAKAFITSKHKADAAAELLRPKDVIPNVHTRLMIDGTIDGFESYEDAVSRYPATKLDQEREGTDMLYSSGTTGRPKGIRVPLSDTAPGDNPTGVEFLAKMLWGVTDASIYLSPAPLYHSAPLRFTMATHRIGGTVVVMEQFDPIEMLRLIERYKVTHLQVVPTMFVRLLKVPEAERTQFDLSSLQAVIHAAAPCPAPVKQQMIDWWGPVIYEYYAGTEGNGFVHCNSEEWLAHPGTVGKAILGTIRICDEQGAEQPAGESGTIYFEGATTFEYHNDSEKTKSSRHPEHPNWSTLGDVGYLTDDGFLFLTDRKAFMIISGGVNIYPQEAENLLVAHPKVMDVAVFGVPNTDFGEEVKAVVQPIDMATAGPDLERELIAYCREHLADVKCPRSIDFRPELPRHPTGKLYKRLLKDEYWAGHDTRII